MQKVVLVVRLVKDPFEKGKFLHVVMLGRPDFVSGKVTHIYTKKGKWIQTILSKKRDGELQKYQHHSLRAAVQLALSYYINTPEELALFRLKHQGEDPTMYVIGILLATRLPYNTNDIQAITNFFLGI